MDSVSQLALGSAVGVAVMGRHTAVWKAALWGAVAGTMPDLDVFIDHGDAVRNMVLHRGTTHSLFWLTLASVPVAAVAAASSGQWRHTWRRWWLAMWLALVTHPLLDTMTVYGTRIGLPFTDHPFGVGSIFIIDPLYTLPLLVGCVWALLARGSARGLRANVAGLSISCLYLAWSVGAQHHAERIARAALQQQGIAADQLLVTPTAFNTVLWRIVAVEGGSYHEGFYSLLDAAPDVRFDRFDRGAGLHAELQGVEAVRLLTDFSKGFAKFEQRDAQILVSDLRMGQEPAYVFTFAVAERHSPPVPLEPPRQVGSRPDTDRLFPWLWRRASGENLPPPR